MFITYSFLTIFYSSQWKTRFFVISACQNICNKFNLSRKTTKCKTCSKLAIKTADVILETYLILNSNNHDIHARSGSRAAAASKMERFVIIVFC